MKKKQVQELHLKTVAELMSLAAGIKHDVVKMQLEMSQKKVKNVNELRTKMKERARFLTIAHAKRGAEKK